METQREENKSSPLIPDILEAGWVHLDIELF